MKGQKREPGKEYIPAGEEALVAEMVREMKEQMTRMYSASKALRQVHTKMHGCVKAEFIIEKNLDPKFKVGVFKKEGCFPAWIRFSNGKTEVKADKKADTRGMAIKLMNVPGEKLINHDNPCTQDFILASGPTFFTKNIQQFRGLLKASISKYKLAAPLYLLVHPRMFHRILTKIFIKCAHPFVIPYFSGTPYRYGDESVAVKYMAQPVSTNTLEYTDKSDFNFLRKNMVATLDKHDIYFDFCIQFQEDADINPIEDALIEWKTPFTKVATIRIPAQQFDTTDQNEYGENLTYNIWHSLPVHRPLGGFNRCRGAIYEAMYKWRHDQNKIQFPEPVAGPDFLENLKPPSNGTI